ncbi:MAG: hypothetical protein ABIE74_04345 [Pseudomonadota bacterium]
MSQVNAVVQITYEPINKDEAIKKMRQLLGETLFAIATTDEDAGIVEPTVNKIVQSNNKDRVRILTQFFKPWVAGLLNKVDGKKFTYDDVKAAINKAMSKSEEIGDFAVEAMVELTAFVNEVELCDKKEQKLVTTDKDTFQKVATPRKKIAIITEKPIAMSFSNWAPLNKVQEKKELFDKDQGLYTTLAELVSERVLTWEQARDLKKEIMSASGDSQKAKMLFDAVYPGIIHNFKNEDSLQAIIVRVFNVPGVADYINEVADLLIEII